MDGDNRNILSKIFKTGEDREVLHYEKAMIALRRDEKLFICRVRGYRDLIKRVATGFDRPNARSFRRENPERSPNYGNIYFVIHYDVAIIEEDIKKMEEIYQRLWDKISPRTRADLLDLDD